MKLRSMKKMNKLFSVVLVLLMVFQVTASAEETYLSYNYDAYETSRAVPTVAGYTAEKFITGTSLGSDIGNYNNPQDFYYDNEKYLYLLDSGNSRILVLNTEYKLDHVVSPKDKDGQTALAFQDARGIFVDKAGKIFVADAGAKLVYIFNAAGVLTNTIGAPKSDVLPEGFTYTPIKVLADSTGITYVLSQSCYSGALKYDSNYEFAGFFGSETVKLTAKVVSDQIWKKILPEKMANKLVRSLPIEFQNFDIDNSGFVYTCKYEQCDSIAEYVGQIRKLNYYGYNILWYKSTGNNRNYGDMDWYYDNKLGTVDTNIVDVDVDSEGYINAVDKNRGRVFQYDQESNRLFIFGGSSSQFGCFKTPTAVESVNDDVLVLDADQGAITVFKPNYFANKVHEGTQLYYAGKYTESKSIWEEVLRYDSNYMLANVGLGKAYEAEGNYKEALNKFQIANDKENYSNSYYLYRYNIMHRHFPLFMLGLLIIIIVPMVLSSILKKKRKNDYLIQVGAYRYPFYAIKHPFKGFTMLKDDKLGSVRVANVIVLLFFVVSILIKQNTGFLFRTTRPEDFNIMYTLVGTVGIFLMWVVSNWAISTLMDGEGHFSEIWVFSSYALLPFVLFMVPLVLISHVIVLDESSFYAIAKILIYAWVCICMFMAIREVHQFSTLKTIVTVAMTILGMLIIAALITLIYSMFSQLVTFIGTIINEISLR